MINLIPNEEKKNMVKDFYSRVVIMVFLMLGCSAVLFTVALLPAYFLSRVKENDAELKLEAQRNEPVPVLDQETLAAIQDLEGKINLINTSEENKFLLSEKVVYEIIASKMPSIKITRISYENNPPPQGELVGISGTAPSREELRLFREALENNPVFKNVDLPISNFIKGTNIQFHLNVTPA